MAGNEGTNGKTDQERTGYDAQDITVLEGLEAVRKRPGMYIGSTDTRGLMHCLWEIIDNSVDEALASHCTRVDVTLHPDGSAEVHRAIVLRERAHIGQQCARGNTGRSIHDEAERALR